MALTDTLTAIGNAIRTKDGTAALIPFLDMPQRILAIPSGGGDVVVEKDINFFDYDGTLLFSYTYEEAVALTELPTPQERHSRLRFQGWNYSLSRVNQYSLGAYGRLEVGALYTTKSGATEFDFRFNANRGRDVILQIYNMQLGTVTVDWGDGVIDTEANQSGTIRLTHTYAENKDYTALVDSTVEYQLHGSGTSDNVFAAAFNYYCIGVRCGNRCTGVRQYAFYSAYVMKEFVFSSAISTIGTNAFMNSRSLISAIVPCAFSNTNVFNGCSGLEFVILPFELTTLPSYTFYNCYALRKMFLGWNTTTIGSYSLQNAYALEEVSTGAQNPPTVQTSALTGTNAVCMFYVPKAKLSAYLSNTSWMYFSITGV